MLFCVIKCHTKFSGLSAVLPDLSALPDPSVLTDISALTDLSALTDPSALTDLSVLAVELGDLDGVGGLVAPVQVASDPVDRDAVRIAQSRLVQPLSTEKT